MSRTTAVRTFLPAMAAAAIVIAIWSIPRERELARAEAHYLEDAEQPRPIAQITARLLERGGVRRLSVTMSAMGDGVSPCPGIEGVDGSNQRTADELARLLADARLRLVTRIDGASQVGDLQRVEHGHVPRRRWRADGGIEMAPPDRAPVPVAVTFLSVPLPRHACATFVEVGGMPRLKVSCEGDELQVESLAEQGR